LFGAEDDGLTTSVEHFWGETEVFVDEWLKVSRYDAMSLATCVLLDETGEDREETDDEASDGRFDFKYSPYSFGMIVAEDAL
jgi:hypothetical protein